LNEHVKGFRCLPPSDPTEITTRGDAQVLQPEGSAVTGAPPSAPPETSTAVNVNPISAAEDVGERPAAAASTPVLSKTLRENPPCSAAPSPSEDDAAEDASRSSTEDLYGRPPNQLDDVTATGEMAVLHPQRLDLANAPAAIPAEPIPDAVPDFPWIDDVLEQVDLELAKSSEGKNPPGVPDFLEDSVESDVPTSTAMTISSESPVMHVAGDSDDKSRKEQSASGKWRMLLAVAAGLLVAVLGALLWTAQKRHVSTEEQSKRQHDGAVANANSLASGTSENSGASKTVMASQAQGEPATVGSSQANVPQQAEQGAPSVTSKSEPVARASHDADQEVAVEKAIPGNLEMNKAKNVKVQANEVSWLWKATARGNPDAPIQLADLYIKGDVVPRNCGQAVELLRTAAINDNVRACNRLALMYAVGICVTSNRVEAYRWLSAALAADPSNEWARQNRDLNWQQMTPEERVLAKKYR
jgi:hypothetical protein